MLVVNRPDQAVPVRFADPVKLDPKSEAIAVRAQTPLPVTLASPAKWEYRHFANADALLNATQVETLDEALNRMGEGGWELVAGWTFKRPKR